MASPYRQPKELKQLKGTHKKYKDVPNEMSVDPIVTIPTPPEDLPESTHDTWSRICSQLAGLKILTPLDLDSIKQYCFQKHMMDEAMEVLKTDGYTVTMTNKAGGSYPMKSPWVAIYNEAATQVNRIGQQFGFSPSSRTKISIGQVKEKKVNPYEGY